MSTNRHKSTRNKANRKTLSESGVGQEVNDSRKQVRAKMRFDTSFKGQQIDLVKRQNGTRICKQNLFEGRYEDYIR